MSGWMQDHAKKRILMIIVFLTAVFVFMTCWAVVQPFNASPDEAMRYQIVQYLVDHGTLPTGNDPEVRNALWGISYAYYPILAYMVMAVPAKIVSLLTTDFMAVLIAARMVNVVFGTITAYFVYRIGELTFKGGARWLFICLTMFLPGHLFLHSYVNVDSMAMLSCAWIVYLWIRSVKEGWTWKICVQLAVAMSICILSHYNAYGYLLCSLLFFVVSILYCQKEEERWKFLLSRGAVIICIVAALTAWWFIRNGLLYQGDFLGLKISDINAEKFAAEGFRPSERPSLKEQGMGLYDMLRMQPESWPHNWIATVAFSFIGTFGFMDIFMPDYLSKPYLLILAIGIFGCLFLIRKLFFVNGTRVEKSRESAEGVTVVHKKIYLEKRWNRQNVMHLAMLAAMVIPFLLLVQYSYTSDLQAQGRYIMPMLVPFMYFTVFGYQAILNRLVKKEKIRNLCYGGIIVLYLAAAIYTYAVVFLPNYL
jgi:4-amino-4-deoxy-L-arabinose transferase-like glycosyltransferase